jgi:hypothetical protein
MIDRPPEHWILVENPMYFPFPAGESISLLIFNVPVIKLAELAAM